jgi:DNA-binding MarR family transcriptional regulator
MEAIAQDAMTRVLPDGGKLLPVLSERQAECLRFIYNYALQKRDYPLGVEVAEYLGVTKQAGTAILNALIKKGYVFRDRMLAQRNLRLTPEGLERMAREVS